MNSNNTGGPYNKNTALLINKYPSFNADILEKYSPSEELEASDAADGLSTARIGSIWVHSSRYPFKEAQKLVKSSIKKKYGLCIVFGFGLGYHVEALLHEFPDLNILIIEPEPGLFLKALCIRDLSEIIGSDRTGFLFDISPSLLPDIILRYRTSNIQSLKLRSVYSRNEEYYTKIDDELKSLIRKKETNMNTLNRFGKTWTRNLFRNIEIFRLARDSGIWFNRFSEIPAVVIAAGPSLDSILPLLPELHKRFVIICVDTALRAVINTGFIPDFIVVVDPQYLNTRHLDDLLASDGLRRKAVLISESSTHPAVFRRCSIPVFFFKSVFPLGKLIERSAGISSELGAGGSVATTAWDLARKLGCPKIYAAGLDLGYPHQNTHCRTSLSSLYTLMKSGRKTPAESINFTVLHNADPYPVENNSGGQTLTDNRLIIYKWWFEGQIGLSRKSNYYNLSEFGVKLDGMTYEPVKALLNSPVIRDSIDMLKITLLNSEPQTEGNFNKIENVLNSIIMECGRLEEVCRKALKILSRISVTSDSGLLSSGIQKLAALDRQISDSPSKELTGFIIQPVLNEIIDEENTVFDNSEKLYRNLLDACEYHRIHASHALKRLQTSPD